MLFDIKGDAASPLQFLATDSARHFLRGSLYFYARPNRDSLAPVIDYIKTDVVHLIETLEWRD
jgi:gliding motility-associated lipoprotein GldD